MNKVFRTVLIVLFVFVSWECFSQPSIQWQKNYGGSEPDEAYDIIQADDGGYLVVGRSSSSDGDIFGYRGGWDIWAIKLDQDGNIQWKKNLGGTENDLTNSVIQLTDGGYLISGYTASNNIDVTNNHGGEFDGWVVKLSSNGLVLWQKTYGGSDYDQIWRSILCDDSGFLMVGKSNSTDGDLKDNNGLFDTWIIKTDSIGNIQWQRTLGGSLDDKANAAVKTLDGGFLIICESNSNDGDKSSSFGGLDFWVIKLSESGDLIWEKSFGGSGQDIPWNIVETPNSDIVISGFTTSSNTGDVGLNHGLFDYWVIKINSNGNLIWQKVLGGSNNERAYSIAISTNEDYVISGIAGSDDGDVVGNDGGAEFWVVKLSKVGDLVWQQTYGGLLAESCYSICSTNDNGLILTGYTWSDDSGDLNGSNNFGKNDYWVLKLLPESTNTVIPLYFPLAMSPNPATTSISLQGLETENEISITLSNLLGQSILQKQMSPDEPINVSNLPKGLYLVSAIGENNKAYLGKFEKL